MAGVARNGVVFPSRSIKWIGTGPLVLRPGRYTIVPVSDTANCVAPVLGLLVTPSSADTGCPVISRRVTSNGAAKSVPS